MIAKFAKSSIPIWYCDLILQNSLNILFLILVHPQKYAIECIFCSLFFFFGDQRF